MSLCKEKDAGCLSHGDDFSDLEIGIRIKLLSKKEIKMQLFMEGIMRDIYIQILI